MVLSRRIYQQLKNIYHYCQAQFWRAYYRWPDKNLKIYGVTGTNGKTTTCIVLGSVLREEFGIEKVGILTTIIFWFGRKEIVNKTKMTTLKSRDVFKHLRQMTDAGIEHVVLEATSHALDQNRLAGLQFSGGIILNLAREHLDYHGDMASYAKAKIKILGCVKSGGVFVYKGDDKWIKRGIRQSINTNKLQSTDVHKFQTKHKPQNTNHKICKVAFTSGQARGIKTALVGEWNKENVLAARLLAKEIGVSSESIDKGVVGVSSVPGRMEWIVLENRNQKIENGDQIPNTKYQIPRVLIDYAVTPDALERVYKEVRRQTKGKIFAVLGACGNRDRGKRPDMARLVAKYADELVLTREDPWTESEEQIFEDLERGLLQSTKHSVQIPNNFQNTDSTNSKQGTKRDKPQNTDRHKIQTKHKIPNIKFRWRRIVDRREAIKYCLEKAGSGDVVVVTGKGAEVGMAIGKQIIPWSEQEVIREELEKIARNNEA